MEVRTGLAGRHAHAEGDASDAHRQWPFGMAHRRRRRAGGRAAGTGRAVSAGPVAQPSRVSQGRPSARRESRRLLAVGTDREGPGRQRRAAGEGARGRHHDAREIPRRRDDQFAEPDHADQDDGQRAGARRLQHRARVHQPDVVRQRQVAHRVALTSRVGRQLAVLPPEHRPQRLRRQVPATFSRTSAAIPSRCPRRWRRRGSRPR